MINVSYRADTLQIKRPSGKVERVNIFYDGGSRRSRYAKIIVESRAEKNQVLHFLLGETLMKGARKGYF